MREKITKKKINELLSKSKIESIDKLFKYFTDKEEIIDKIYAELTEINQEWHKQEIKRTEKKLEKEKKIFERKINELKRGNLIVQEESFRHGEENRKNYFELSGSIESSFLHHTPFIILDPVGIRLCSNAEELITTYKDKEETKILGQWRGRWDSNFFLFTIGQLKYYLEDKRYEERYEEGNK